MFSNAVLLPGVFFNPSLTLSPHVFLLGILFANRAFAASSLTSTEQQLGKLDIQPGSQELLPLPLEESLRWVPVFRRATKTLIGFEMSQTKRLLYSAVAPCIRRMGELTEFKFRPSRTTCGITQATSLAKEVCTIAPWVPSILCHSGGPVDLTRTYPV